MSWPSSAIPTERVELVCRAWALQGYGAPIGVYLVYAIKIRVPNKDGVLKIGMPVDVDFAP
jgi:hypothetical protein